MKMMSINIGGAFPNGGSSNIFPDFYINFKIVCYLYGRISDNSFMLIWDLQNNILIKINNENLVSQQTAMTYVTNE